MSENVDTQTALPSAVPDCPFRGLDAFSEQDREYFFGREEDSTTIGANVLTAPLTVLYGASGVGKSSTIMAGVVPMLRAQRNVTTVLFRSWQAPDLIPEINRAIDDAVFRRLGLHADVTAGFDVCVASAVAATNAPILILFDQFEEFLLYHESQSGSGEAFDLQFARLVNRPDAPVSFLISIREDWLARLDRYQLHIPNLLSNVIRLDHLDDAGARRAITIPIEHYNEVLVRTDPAAETFSIESTLVDVILTEVRAGVGLQRGEGSGRPSTSDDKVRIETPFLQMILIALWEAERKTGSRLLRAVTLQRLGGASHIVHSYVDATVRFMTRQQQEICARMFDRLVTPSGSKIAHSAQDLADFAQVPASAIANVLEVLTKNRILRQVASPSLSSYEIFHDVLARPILRWRMQYLAARRARRIARRSFAVSATLVLLLVAISVLYSIHRRRDRHELEAHREADALMLNASRDPRPAGIVGDMFLRAFRVYSAANDTSELTALEEAVFATASHFKGTDAVKLYELAARIAQNPNRRIRALTEAASLQYDLHDLSGARASARSASACAETMKVSSRSWFRIGEMRKKLGQPSKALDASEMRWLFPTLPANTMCGWMRTTTSAYSCTESMTPQRQSSRSKRL